MGDTKEAKALVKKYKYALATAHQKAPSANTNIRNKSKNKQKDASARKTSDSGANQKRTLALRQTKSTLNMKVREENLKTHSPRQTKYTGAYKQLSHKFLIASDECVEPGGGHKELVPRRCCDYTTTSNGLRKRSDGCGRFPNAANKADEYAICKSSTVKFRCFSTIVSTSAKLVFEK